MLVLDIQNPSGRARRCARPASLGETLHSAIHLPTTGLKESKKLDLSNVADGRCPFSADLSISVCRPRPTVATMQCLVASGWRETEVIKIRKEREQRGH